MKKVLRVYTAVSICELNGKPHRVRRDSVARSSTPKRGLLPFRFCSTSTPILEVATTKRSESDLQDQEAPSSVPNSNNSLPLFRSKSGRPNYRMNGSAPCSITVNHRREAAMQVADNRVPPTTDLSKAPPNP